MTDGIVVSFKDAVLRCSDAQTLWPSEWISDAILVFFYEVLAQRYPAVLRRGRISLWQPAVVELMCSLGEYAEGVLPPPSDIAFLPISDRYMDPSSISTHWSLLVIAPRTAYHLDSLSTSNETAARFTLAQFQACYRPPSSPSMAFDEVAMPLQSNAHDCGLYPIFLTHTVLKLQNEQEQQCDLKEAIESAAQRATPDTIDRLRRQCNEWIDRWALLLEEAKFPMEEWDQVQANIGMWEEVNVI
ncbi:cysteine proteinase [Acaromyces ingoldii]|uniref:Cysteine proteinase n=1 Tax=Acaromyces ingoldii TaxID=215250 RepID=A0A316YRC7_9BASI|nr:cysteine proteinase [Acaromyces ingoldii]PWN91849.1 cysteine proteinase [Acaromyces ingoldii]